MRFVGINLRFVELFYMFVHTKSIINPLIIKAMKSKPTTFWHRFKLEYVLIGLVFAFSQVSFAQIIAVNNNFTPQELIENNLIEGCVEVSNISSQVNGSSLGIGSYGYFDRDQSNFPFENGIILSTGSANSGGNAINTNTLNEGETSWGTDTDLETALGISNTFNATSIEFDFVSISNLITFDYILASEEYFADYPCNYSDGFAFLIKEAGTADPYTNIALIPGTSIPVNTNTIHDAIAGFCGAENEAFFDGYNIGDTNYNGRTNVLTASANIIPYVQYHIKLVIADQTDENYDSAVFIQGNSFNSTVDLGEDIITCADNYTIDGDIQNAQATYSWYLNGGLITGESNPTLNAVASGTYEVSISIPLNDMDCVITDSVEITLNSEQSIDTISDFELCDNDENGSESFDLSLLTNDIINSLAPNNYNLTYHYSQSEAQNGTNAITTPVISAANSLEIFVRVEDIDNGCLTYGSFNLIINPIPDVSGVTAISVCDDEINDGSTEIYLTDYISDITMGDPDLFVTFHYTQLDAENGLNIIGSPYVNTSPTETLYASVLNTATGCINTAPITISVEETPTLQNQELTPLSACEPEGGDGFEFFDLTEVYPELLQGLTNVTVTFHETITDAELDLNPILDPDNYLNTLEFVQQIYIRVEDDVTGCATITSVFIHANILITGTNIDSFGTCDDSSADGIEDFDLLSLGIEIINDVDDTTIAFYETEDDQENQINELDQLTPYTVTSSPQTLYITLTNLDCEHEAEIELIIYPPIDLQPIAPIDYCDADDDGFTPIQFSQFDDLFLNGSTVLFTSYHLTQDDADNNINPLPAFYTNTSSTETFFVRVSPGGTDCFDVMSFDVNVIPAPTVIDTQDVFICDNDQDGFFIVNLDSLIPQIVSSTTGLTITIHDGLAEATDGINPIPNSSVYNATTETVYYRVENNTTGCFAIVYHNITVNTLPIIPAISNFFSCELDGNQIAEFLFVDKDLEILNGQVDKQVLYFETQTDAINRTNEIDKNNIYLNTSPTQTIYVRVENLTDQDCFEVASFELEIGSIPIFDAPSNFLVCDDLSNDGIDVFNLNDKTTEMSQNSPETLDITYYTTFDDADAEINPIPNINNYTNIENPQQIFARIENGTVCHAVASFSLNVVQVPSANTPSEITLCDNDYDESTFFDLTDAEVEILDIRNDDILISYFETIEDLENGVNQIATPDNYANISNPQIVQVKVENTISGCYAVVPLELNVNSPPLINDIPLIEFCGDNTGIYSLFDATEILVDDTTDAIISYYNNLNDANSNQNNLDNNYNYSIGSQTIFIRADNIVTNCFAIMSFELVAYPSPIANTAPDLETCDDDYDNFYIFDLEEQNQYILGTQNPSQYSISYHLSNSDAEQDLNALDYIFDAFDNLTIYARIENTTTGCYSISTFNIYVNRKPLVEIPDQVLCINNPPLVVTAGNNIVFGDTYLWSTNETTSSIEITSIGQYSVTVTTPFGCQTTTTFNVTESEAATIEVTETVDFSDPNNVTVTVSGIGDYVYQLNNNPPQTTGFFQFVPLGYNTITIIDLNGCASVTKEIIVIDAPKFFTPNGDSYFDDWHIIGIEFLEGTVINIYDRYGKLITVLDWLSPGWNGYYNGNLMPATDYWFVADVKKDGVAFQVKGHFALRL